MRFLKQCFRRICLGGLFGLIIITIGWAGEPRNIHLSWTDGINTDTTMTVTWMEPTNDDTVVQFGESSGNYTWEQPATRKQAEALGDEYVHEAWITGLAPNTRYYYRCGNDANWSTEHDFQTAPAKGSNTNFRFVVSSDSHSMQSTKIPPSRRHEIANQIKGLYPQPGLLLSGGDEISGYSAEQETYLFQWDRAFSLTDGPAAVRGAWAKLLREVPYMGSDSNHVTTHASLFDLFRYPWPWDSNRSVGQSLNKNDALNEKGNRYWYSFNYGNAHFIVLQINTGKKGENQTINAFKAPELPEKSPQYDWLEKDLEAANSDPNIRWKFAIWHAPAYSKGGVARNKKIQKTICRLLTKHKVDIAFAGHRHRYERSNKISNTDEATAGAGTVEEKDVSQYDRSIPGVVYIVTGGAGGGVKADQEVNPASSHTRYTARADGEYINYKAYNYVIVDIDNDTGTLTAKARGFRPSQGAFGDVDFEEGKEVELDKFTIANIPLKVISDQSLIMPGSAFQPVDIEQHAIDRDHAFAIISASNDSGGAYTDDCGTFQVSAKFNEDGSTLDLERAVADTASGANVSYHVVQSRNISVQHGSSRILSGPDPINRSIDVDLPQGAVDMDNSIVILSSRSAASRQDHDQTQVIGYLTSDAELRLERGDGTDASVDIEWSVVTFAPGYTIQTGERTFTADEKEASVELQIPTDPSRSWLYFTASAAGGEAKMKFQKVRGRISNGNTLAFNRYAQNGTFLPTVRWYVVQFPEGAGMVYHSPDILSATAADNLLGYSDFEESRDSFIYHSADGDGFGSAFARTYWINRFVDPGVEFERWTTQTAGNIDWQVVRFPE